jgi:ATP-dependent RNA helicase RhlE
VRSLAKAGIAAEAIHGNKSQGQRERVLAAFRKGDVRTLVATDIAARGIDVDGISHVVNYDMPNVAETYVHRIGRTARAGATGVAISLCDAEEAAFLRDIEKLIRTVIPATDRRTGSPRPIHVQSEGARNRSQPNRGRGHEARGHGPRGHDTRGSGPAARQPHAQRQRQPERHPQLQRHPDDLTGVEFLNRAAKVRREDGRRPQR